MISGQNINIIQSSGLLHLLPGFENVAVKNLAAVKVTLITPARRAQILLQEILTIIL